MLLYLDGEEQLPRCCFCTIFATNKIYLSGSGCGSVGRAVASDSRGPQFKSRHWQKNYIRKKESPRHKLRAQGIM